MAGARLKNVERGLRLARFPYVKTLEQFDFSFQPAIDRKLIRELAGLAFVERAENLILLGPPGTGKTMLAVALGIKAIEAGHRVLFLTLETLITRLRRAQAENRLEWQLAQGNWGEVFGDQVLATVILDRFLHHSSTINIKGESFRLKEKRRAGLLSQQATENTAAPARDSPKSSIGGSA